MIKKQLNLLIATLCISLIMIPISTKAGLEEVSANPENYIVFFEEGFSYESIDSYDAKLVEPYETIQAATLKVDRSTLSILLDKNIIKFAYKENKVEINGQYVPYGHKNINLPAKIPSTLTGKGIKVAIIDTGVATDHPDLTVRDGTCALESYKCKNSYNDDNGHGTHVAGVVAAKDNDYGIVGVAPYAEIYAVKALDQYGNGTTTTIMAGLDWAIKQDVDIINLSLTTPFEDYGMKALIDQAVSKGIIVIAAAGNEGTRLGTDNTVLYPAKFPNVIAVSAVNQSNHRINSSSTGSEVELAAPGDGVYSTLPTSIDSDGYGYMTGTSMATPFVAGLAALYKEKYPNYTNTQIRTLLQQNARDLGSPGRDTFYGYGLAQVDVTPIKPPSSVTINHILGTNGTVQLDMQPLLDKYASYNVYRYDQLISENTSKQILEDYGVKGQLEYTVYPIDNGTENRSDPVYVDLVIETPAFSDLSNSKWYSRYMMYLNTKDILTGYNGSEMRPEKYVSRAEAVAMLGRALKLDGTKRGTRFKDVGTSSFASGYIESAADQGILNGFPDKTFRPDEAVTRAEMAILLAKAYNLPIGNSVAFSDVNVNVTGYQEIHKLAGAKITEGFVDGTFRPYEKMLRSTYSVFLARAEEDSFK
ncbi:S8 family serine peptidase [Cytobacillus spongiae]|uniref:S8 family peptidase n=1 Tax=Cytobacillus spongiae TaxID=2901381 RepID=UPI001F41444C|nr:S8 family serine peptidase [Cytobacillus spongiae]UII55693.1 S8 family serine peptidase [Cytobacillus spongiae]